MKCFFVKRSSYSNAKMVYVSYQFIVKLEILYHSKKKVWSTLFFINIWETLTRQESAVPSK